MNQERFAGLCRQVRGKLKMHLGRLRDSPELAASGVRDGLAGKIQEGYGASKEQAARDLKRFLARHRNWIPPVR